jgi:hypothetical protein
MNNLVSHAFTAEEQIFRYSLANALLRNALRLFRNVPGPSASHFRAYTSFFTPRNA